MPVKSKAQEKLMQGIAHGTIPPKGGLTKEKAAEFLNKTPKNANLPEKAKKKP